MKYQFTNQITKELKKFQKHLKKKNFNENTIRQNSNYAGIFLEWIETENLEKQEIRYKEIIAFIHELQQEKGSRFIGRVILAVRHYYEFLDIPENPASGIYLKGKRTELPSNLVEYKELKKLYENYETPNNRTKRNKIMLGLMIYQALTTEELRKIEPHHIKLREAKIYVPGGKHSNPRTLEMQAIQLIDMQEYLQIIRPKMLEVIGNFRSGRKPNKVNLEAIKEQLFFSENGSENIKSSLYHLFRKLRACPEKSGKTDLKLTSTKIIRQSVIAHWLKEKGIREVQYMAGHRYVSSTQRYRDYNMDELSQALNEYHPLNSEALA